MKPEIVVVRGPEGFASCRRCGNKTAILLKDRAAPTFCNWVQCCVCGVRTFSDDTTRGLEEEWRSGELIESTPDYWSINHDDLDLEVAADE